MLGGANSNATIITPNASTCHYLLEENEIK
jgi:hypothetical protein